PAVCGELPTSTAEVLRMLARSGAGGGTAFRNAIDRLVELLDLLGAPRGARGAAVDPGQPPVPSGERASAPMALRVTLARYAATATPVPVAWARSWAWYHPSLAPRAAQLRCREEFDRLFALRYVDRYGAGLVPPGDAP